MKTRELSNHDIIDIMNHLKTKRNKIKFHGCFYKDQMPENNLLGEYIVNLDSSHKNRGGTHWCALIVDRNFTLFMDPFGLPPANEIKEFIQKRVKAYYWNNEIIQNIDSILCGYYCIGCIYASMTRNRLQSVQDWINMFKDNTEYNDKILQKYINRLF